MKSYLRLFPDDINWLPQCQKNRIQVVTRRNNSPGILQNLFKVTFYGVQTLEGVRINLLIDKILFKLLLHLLKNSKRHLQANQERTRMRAHRIMLGTIRASLILIFPYQSLKSLHHLTVLESCTIRSSITTLVITRKSSHFLRHGLFERFLA